MSGLQHLFDDIKMFLPKYLSEEDTKKLLHELNAFPENIDNRVYSSLLEKEDVIFQGDGFKNFTVVNLPAQNFYTSPVIVLSNTCDIDPVNPRPFSSNICYAPLFSLSKYEKKLEDEKIKTGEALQGHITAIKKQQITQILYLPQGGKLPEDCIVFLDRINHCDNSSVLRGDLSDDRLFILSQYGFYLFLLKFSIHFTRIQENVQR